jgi:hypothetical protein
MLAVSPFLTLKRRDRRLQRESNNRLSPAISVVGTDIDYRIAPYFL